MAATYILAIDQGTTSSRAILFDREGKPAAVAQAELPQHYPADGWVEHDADRIWNDTVAVVRGVVEKARAKPEDVAAIGITNQRETTVSGTARPATDPSTPSSGRTGGRRSSAAR